MGIATRARRGRLPRRASIDLTVLEFYTQIRLEELVLVLWIDRDVANTAGTVITITAPAVGST